MKPLARLILSRQRLYEKHNCEGPESKVLPDLEEYCAVTEWQDWSPCNVDCGRGTRHRQRTYKLKVVDQHKQRETCKKTLTQRSSCYGVKPECPQDGPPAEECELTQWGKWSECSVTCGNGTKTRSRRYRTRAAAKHCQQVTNNPPRLEQNLPCSLPPCDWTDAIPPECVDRAWSEWSTCSVTCGKGTKMRRKLTINTEDLNRHNRISRSYDEESEEDIFGESEDECENVIERVECYNDEAPSCDESTTIPGVTSIDGTSIASKGNASCSVTAVARVTKTIFERWRCASTSAATIKTRPLSKQQTIVLYRNGVTGQPVAPHAEEDLKLKRVEFWQQPAGDGGKPCPEKLKKKKKCKLTSCSKDGDQDCVMSDWSSWSPCNYSCGPNAVRQRTRNILQQPTGNGQPCESRVDIIKCDLTVCPDY
ncbi:spondin [Holotrichia oblita]|uniref:Spondin n=1 Tax=Holotrichia oblita TaxID=644536 RepID=A0ACB9T6N8_HOLOL|nr:spondin [Holotrichia oblita]